MRPPPVSVVFVARTHWTVGLVMAVSIALLYWVTHNLPRIEFGSPTYLIAGALGALYLLGGTLVWFGAPFGRVISRLCGLLYLARPQFGSRIWETMNSAEFQAHFTRH
jgi:hypothetical protein